MATGAGPLDSHVRVSCGGVRALLRRCRVRRGGVGSIGNSSGVSDGLSVRTNEVAGRVVSVVPSSLGFISIWGVLLVYLWGQG